MLTGPGLRHQHQRASVSGPLAVTITMKNPWAPFPYYLAQAQTGYVAAPSMLNAPTGHVEPGRHRALRLPGLGAQQPHDGHPEPEVLAHGLSRT